jgi:hypothetical protein
MDVIHPTHSETDPLQATGPRSAHFLPPNGLNARRQSAAERWGARKHDTPTAGQRAERAKSTPRKRSCVRTQARRTQE